MSRKTIFVKAFDSDTGRVKEFDLDLPTTFAELKHKVIEALGSTAIVDLLSTSSDAAGGQLPPASQPSQTATSGAAARDLITGRRQLYFNATLGDGVFQLQDERHVQSVLAAMEDGDTIGIVVSVFVEGDRERCVLVKVENKAIRGVVGTAEFLFKFCPARSGTFETLRIACHENLNLIPPGVNIDALYAAVASASATHQLRRRNNLDANGKSVNDANRQFLDTTGDDLDALIDDGDDDDGQLLDLQSRRKNTAAENNNNNNTNNTTSNTGTSTKAVASTSAIVPSSFFFNLEISDTEGEWSLVRSDKETATALLDKNGIDSSVMPVVWVRLVARAAKPPKRTLPVEVLFQGSLSTGTFEYVDSAKSLLLPALHSCCHNIHNLHLLGGSSIRQSDHEGQNNNASDSYPFVLMKAVTATDQPFEKPIESEDEVRECIIRARASAPSILRLRMEKKINTKSADNKNNNNNEKSYFVGDDLFGGTVTVKVYFDGDDEEDKLKRERLEKRKRQLEEQQKNINAHVDLLTGGGEETSTTFHPHGSSFAAAVGDADVNYYQNDHKNSNNNQGVFVNSTADIVHSGETPGVQNNNNNIDHDEENSRTPGDHATSDFFSLLTGAAPNTGNDAENKQEEEELDEEEEEEEEDEELEEQIPFSFEEDHDDIPLKQFSLDNFHPNDEALITLCKFCLQVGKTCKIDLLSHILNLPVSNNNNNNNNNNNINNKNKEVSAEKATSEIDALFENTREYLSKYPRFSCRVGFVFAASTITLSTQQLPQQPQLHEQNHSGANQQIAPQSSTKTDSSLAHALLLKGGKSEVAETLRLAFERNIPVVVSVKRLATNIIHDNNSHNTYASYSTSSQTTHHAHTSPISSPMTPKGVPTPAVLQAARAQHQQNKMNSNSNSRNNSTTVSVVGGGGGGGPFTTSPFLKNNNNNLNSSNTGLPPLPPKRSPSASATTSPIVEHGASNQAGVLSGHGDANETNNDINNATSHEEESPNKSTKKKRPNSTSEKTGSRMRKSSSSSSAHINNNNGMEMAGGKNSTANQFFSMMRELHEKNSTSNANGSSNAGDDYVGDFSRHLKPCSFSVTPEEQQMRRAEIMLLADEWADITGGADNTTESAATEICGELLPIMLSWHPSVHAVISRTQSTATNNNQTQDIIDENAKEDPHITELFRLLKTLPIVFRRDPHFPVNLCDRDKLASLLSAWTEHITTDDAVSFCRHCRASISNLADVSPAVRLRQSLARTFRAHSTNGKVNVNFLMQTLIATSIEGAGEFLRIESRGQLESLLERYSSTFTNNNNNNTNSNGVKDSPNDYYRLDEEDENGQNDTDDSDTDNNAHQKNENHDNDLSPTSSPTSFMNRKFKPSSASHGNFTNRRKCWMPRWAFDEIVTYLTDGDPHAIDTLFSVASTIRPSEMLRVSTGQQHNNTNSTKNKIMNTNDYYYDSLLPTKRKNAGSRHIIKNEITDSETNNTNNNNSNAKSATSSSPLLLPPLSVITHREYHLRRQIRHAFDAISTSTSINIIIDFAASVEQDQRMMLAVTDTWMQLAWCVAALIQHPVHREDSIDCSQSWKWLRRTLASAAGAEEMLVVMRSQGPSYAPHDVVARAGTVALTTAADPQRLLPTSIVMSCVSDWVRSVAELTAIVNRWTWPPVYSGVAVGTTLRVVGSAAAAGRSKEAKNKNGNSGNNNNEENKNSSAQSPSIPFAATPSSGIVEIVNDNEDPQLDSNNQQQRREEMMLIMSPHQVLSNAHGAPLGVGSHRTSPGKTRQDQASSLLSSTTTSSPTMASKSQHQQTNNGYYDQRSPPRSAVVRVPCPPPPFNPIYNTNNNSVTATARNISSAESSHSVSGTNTNTPLMRRSLINPQKFVSTNPRATIFYGNSNTNHNNNNNIETSTPKPNEATSRDLHDLQKNENNYASTAITTDDPVLQMPERKFVTKYSHLSGKGDYTFSRNRAGVMAKIMRDQNKSSSPASGQRNNNIAAGSSSPRSQTNDDDGEGSASLLLNLVAQQDEDMKRTEERMKKFRDETEALPQTNDEISRNLVSGIFSRAKQDQSMILTAEHDNDNDEHDEM